MPPYRDAAKRGGPPPGIPRGDGVNRVEDVDSGESLDGNISPDIEDGTLPSGEGTAGGDGPVVVGALEGVTDVDGE